MSLLVLNYSHPLTSAQIADIERLCGEAPEVRTIPTHIDRSVPLATVARDLAEAANLLPSDWQTRALLVNLPALAPVAAALLAEIHGRSGGFPTIINIRPVADSTPMRYEVGEVVNIQSIRDRARGMRQ